jgi:hypothetical protein
VGPLRSSSALLIISTNRCPREPRLILVTAHLPTLITSYLRNGGGGGAGAGAGAKWWERGRTKEAKAGGGVCV